MKIFVRWSSYVCLALILIFSLLFILYGSTFAEIGLHLPGLDFPLFIGELLTLGCIAVLVAHLFVDQVPWKGEGGWRLYALVYFIWVLAKTGEGYWHGGPYALRNAALFYYPVFAIMVEHFFRRSVHPAWPGFREKVAVGSPLIFEAGVGFVSVGLALAGGYAGNPPLMILSLCGLPLIQRTWLRRLFIIGIALYCLWRLGPLSGGRGLLVGTIAALVYLFWYAGRIFGIIWWKQLTAALVAVVLVAGIVWTWGDHNAVMSLLTPSRVGVAFREYDAMVQSKKADYIPRDLTVKYYNRNAPYPISSDGVNPANGMQYLNGIPVISPLVVAPAAPQVIQHNAAVLHSNGTGAVDTRPVGMSEAGMGSEKKTILVKDARPVEVVIQPQCPVAPAYRVVATTYNNMVFRLFIWRDMFHEMWQQHPFGGFSFGKPQRSVSLEILDWAGHEWRRDGWITPHNSFLHYIYRGGVVGLGLIGVIVCVLFQMTEIFLQHRSWRGGLLVAALISWIVTAQFGVILELPYHAIPFWSLYGLTAAYCYHMSRTNGAES